jgi:hypothetical protein
MVGVGQRRTGIHYRVSQKRIFSPAVLSG